MEEQAKKIANYFNPKVYYSVDNVYDDKWIGTLSIGEYYYETNPYDKKEDAISDISQCMFNIKRQIETALKSFVEENTTEKNNAQSDNSIEVFITNNNASIRLRSAIARILRDNEGGRNISVTEFTNKYKRRYFRCCRGVGNYTLNELTSLFEANNITWD